jgi:hypothetical protein
MCFTSYIGKSCSHERNFGRQTELLTKLGCIFSPWYKNDTEIYLAALYLAMQLNNVPKTMFHGIRLRRPDPDPCLLQAVVPLSLVRLL